MRVLSLFGGIECGYLALKRAGIPISEYYSSEIDKFPIRIAKYNFPDIVQLGDVKQISGKDLPPIDLVMGGSPCQSFSQSGNRKNFDDPRGRLFWEFVRILEEVSPSYFFLENVKMKKEWEQIITDSLKVEPILLNSSLVSAQNRERLYWTNIPFIGYPEDKGIVMRDILEDGYSDRAKSYCIDANYHKGGNLKNYFEKGRRQLVFNEKIDRCFQVGEADIKGRDSVKRVYSEEGKAPTLTAMQGGHREPKVAVDRVSWRKLTPRECERLQTMPDDFTRYGYIEEKDQVVEMSKTQRYKAIGNGWTVDLISHFFQELSN